MVFFWGVGESRTAVHLEFHSRKGLKTLMFSLEFS